MWVPDEQTEALRDLERSRDDAKNAERVTRHQLGQFFVAERAGVSRRPLVDTEAQRVVEAAEGSGDRGGDRQGNL